jgi:hypothetical protein
MATTHHGDFLFPRKKASLSVFFRPTSHEISSKTEKYTIMITSIENPDMQLYLFYREVGVPTLPAAGKSDHYKNRS